MYPLVKDESLIETKTCKHCNASFPITDKDLEFYDKVSPVFSGKKYSIPTPTLCSDCRQQRRLSFRNERKLYKRKCDATGKDIVSVYSPDKLYKVYHQDYWWSDKWDPMDYGRNFDFERGFFEQFSEIMQSVPRVNIINKNSENSDYTHISAFNKDCYLLVESSRNRDCLYGYWLQQATESVDCAFLNSCERCYATIDSENCFEIMFSENCKDCANSIFLKDCINCKDCIACSGQSGKQYMILNKQHSKEEYTEMRKSILHKSGVLENIGTEFKKLLSAQIHKYTHVNNSAQCTGDYISNANNISNSYEIHEAKDIAYSAHVWANSHSCMDVDTVGLNCSFVFESINTAIDSVGDSFCNRCWTVTKSFLSNDCDNSSHLFGCIGLRNKSFCILNKQYTKEEYETLVPKIIEHMQKTGEWGEFFPSSMSPFGYNETVAQEYFPLSKSEAIKDKVFNWSDYEAPFPKVEKIIPASKLPEDITQIPDDILNWAIECEVTHKPFRIIKQELEFYRKHNLPIPKRHPDQRHLDRMALRNPRKLFERRCDKCGVGMITTYSPERKEIVYCESCYEKEVIG